MSYDLVKEDVPGFIKRIGDRVIFGSNNVTVVLGTDRASPSDAGLDAGYGHINSPDKGVKAGAYHIIVGREGQNPNFDTDKGYIYVSMRTDIDTNAGTPQEFETNDVPGTIIKSDAVRIVGRKDIKLVASDTYMTMADTSVVLGGEKIFFGAGDATEPVILGNKHQKEFDALVRAHDALVTAFIAHVHMFPVVGGAPTSPTVQVGPPVTPHGQFLRSLSGVSKTK